MAKREENAQRLMQALYRIARSRHTLSENLLSRYGVTLHQFHLMMYMKASGAIRVTDLSDRMMVAKPTASRMINTLEEKGMVEKKADDSDRRLVVLVLTPKGERAVEEMKARQKEFLAKVFDKIPAGEMAAFVDTMERIEGELTALSRGEAAGGTGG